MKKGREWSIRFIVKTPALTPAPPAALAVPSPAEPEPPRLVAELVNRGVTKTTASALVQRRPAERIEAKIAVFDWMKERNDKRIGKSPTGYLVKSINDDYAAPEDFRSKTERERQAEAVRQRQQADADARRRQQEEVARKSAENAAIAVYWASLTPEEQSRLQAEAFAAGGEEARQTYETMKRFRGGTGYLEMLRDDHIRGILQKLSEPA